MKMANKRNSVLLIANNYIEEKALNEALKTPFDTVMEILHNVEKYLRKNNQNLANDVKIAINLIRSQKLYKYQALDENYSDIEQNPEIRNIIGYLKQYSTKNKFTNMKKSFQTSKFNEIPKEMRNKFNLMNRKISDNKTKLDGNESDNENESESESKSDSENSSEENEKLFDDYLSDDEDTIHHISNLSPENRNKVINNLGKKNKKTHLSFSNSLNSMIEKELLDIHFNIFNYYPELKNKNSFINGTFFLIEQFDQLKIIKENILKNFLNILYEKYSSSTAIYHTERHALDVLQTVYIYTFKTNVINMIKLNYLDILSLGLASIAHDLSHPGYSNDYLIRSSNNLAINYNDIHVLENFHISEMFHILQNNQDKDTNIFSNLQIEDYRFVRKRIIDLILATDMQNHAKICSLMKNFEYKNEKENNHNQNSYSMIEQQDVMNFLIHTADISHCSKEFEISYKWTELINQEFWREGDEEKEKKMQVGFLCERNNADIPTSQIGFIKGIILPTFEILYNSFPNEDILFYLNNVKKNLEEWSKLVVKK
jgi:calcium/calmodulin-dependent 3',5'-cyclic nucleotide phosphodiesterase